MDNKQFLKDRVFRGTKDERKLICKDSLLLFALYYFSEYFTYDLADFHYEMINDLKDLLQTNPEIDDLLWVMFKEAAKTVWAKIAIIWVICYEKKHYINWDGYDMDNAEAALFDITTELQSNKLILRDFGQLYTEPVSFYQQKQKKRLTEFITVNKIKVQAFTIRKPVRGRLYKRFRPDFTVFDDFENYLTIVSKTMLKKIQKHLDEAKTGMAVGAARLYLGNLISESGIIQQLINASEEDPRMRYRRVDVEDSKGNPVWTDKYTKTDAEALKVNRTLPPDKAKKVSLEAKRRSFNAGGRKVYEVEMLNSPEAAGDLYFDRKRVKLDMQKAKESKPIKEVADMRFWCKYQPHHKFAVGSDSAGGDGNDSNAAVAINFSTIPIKVAACYSNNEIEPDVFAYDVKRMADYFGECYIIPEKNNQGIATITTLKDIYDVGKIHRNVKAGKDTDKPEHKYGWDTNGTTKYLMFSEFKTAYEDGQIEVLDLALLKEMFSFTKNNLANVGVRDSTAPDTTNHFDLLTAAVVCYQARKYAPDPKIRAKALQYKQPDYEGSSVFESGTLQDRKLNFKRHADPIDPFADFDNAARLENKSESSYNSGEDYEQPPFDS